MQNTIGKLREDEAEEGNMKKEEEYEVINISSSEFINQLDFLQDNYDIILVDFPGNLKQNGVIETLHFVDVIIIPFEPKETEREKNHGSWCHEPCASECTGVQGDSKG